MEKQTAVQWEDIGKIPLFQGVTQSELEELLQAAHQLQRQAGEFFFLQGDPAERMFVLLKGRVKLSQDGPDGQQVLIRVITPISPFAVVAITTASTYLVTAQAAEDSLAIYWTRQELMEFVSRIPQMSQNAMLLMAERLQELQERFREVTTQRVEQRLAHTLMRLAAQSGKKVQEGILIDLKITREDLARMSGTTLHTVSRMLSQWEDQGLVISGRERVIIRNPHGLARIVEGV